MGDTVVSLPDLRNEDQQVQNILGTWISELVSNYSSRTFPWPLWNID